MTTESRVDFSAVDESGNRYLLRAYETVLVASDLNRTGSVPGLIDSMETSDGRSVRKTGPGTYVIELTGTILHSDDPAAP